MSGDSRLTGKSPGICKVERSGQRLVAFAMNGFVRLFCLQQKGDVAVLKDTHRRAWSYDETVVALGLYFQVTFSRTNMNHPEIVRVAKILGRTPSAVAMKVINFARLDPTLRVEGISGLAHGAKTEIEVWNAYAGRMDDLAYEYNRLLKGKAVPPGDEAEEMPIPEGLERIGVAKYRVNQSFFRRAVLSAYADTCCVTGIDDARLLTASHIKPWASCATGDEKTTPANGLCLNALHDRAFDRGLVTVDTSLRLVLSKSLKDVLSESVYNDFFLRYEGRAISLPQHHSPKSDFLEYHNNHVFIQ